MNNGIDIDILYRDMDEFAAGAPEVMEGFHPRSSYTTCMWHNLLTCKIIFNPRNGSAIPSAACWTNTKRKAVSCPFSTGRCW